MLCVDFLCAARDFRWKPWAPLGRVLVATPPGDLERGFPASRPHAKCQSAPTWNRSWPKHGR